MKRRRHARVKKVAPYGGNGIVKGVRLFYRLFISVWEGAREYREWSSGEK